MVQIMLSRLLEKQKMSISDLAEKTQLHRNTINNLINKKTEGIQFDTLEKICFALKCNIQDLLKLEGGTQQMHYDTVTGRPSINDYAEQLAKKCDGSVVDFEFSPINGWSPLILKPSQEKLMLFLVTYGYSGEYNGVAYKVQENSIIFTSYVGKNIEDML